MPNLLKPVAKIAVKAAEIIVPTARSAFKSTSMKQIDPLLLKAPEEKKLLPLSTTPQIDLLQRLGDFKKLPLPVPDYRVIETSHPCDPFAEEYRGVDGEFIRPTIFQEGAVAINRPHVTTDAREEKLLDVPYFWYFTDHDGHPQSHIAGLFTAGALQSAKAGLKANGLSPTHDIIKNIDELYQTLVDHFNNKKPVDLKAIAPRVGEIFHQIEKYGPPQNTKIPVKGCKFHYRLGSENLRDPKGLEEIEKRLQEAKMLELQCGTCPIADIIIANCTSTKEIDQLRDLIQKAGLSRLSIIPLLEKVLPEKDLDNIIEHPDVKVVMLAGSDSRKREGWAGATAQFIRVQQKIHKTNEKLRLSGEEEKILFLGRGTSHYRMDDENPGALLLPGMKIWQTIQGPYARLFRTDSAFRENYLNNFLSPKTATDDELRIGLVILDKMYEAHQKPREESASLGYMERFKTEDIATLCNNNNKHGSRGKTTSSVEIVNKGAEGFRAITFGMLNMVMGYDHWMTGLANNPKFEEVKVLLLDNLDNPAAQALINHMTLEWQSISILRASKWITDEKLLKDLTSSYEVVTQFLNEVHQHPKKPSNLQSLTDLRRLYGLQHVLKEGELTKEMVDKIFTEVGTGRLVDHPGAQLLMRNRGLSYSTSKPESSHFSNSEVSLQTIKKGELNQGVSQFSLQTIKQGELAEGAKRVNIPNQRAEISQLLLP